MIVRRLILCAVLPLSWAGQARAALSPQQNALRQKAVAELFNLNFADSRAQLRAFINLDPRSPFGYLFESGVLWWQASSEYGLFKDTPTLQGLFEQDVDQTVDLSREGFNAGDADQRAGSYFAAGMALGVRGQWNLSRGRYLKAYHDGKHAIKYLKKCLKIDPEYHDAYLGLGIFDYQTARLPRILRLPALFMVHGDAQRGLERIRDAAANGRMVSSQAETFLLSLLILDEHDYPQALSVLRELRRKFPDSPYFRFIEVLLLDQTNDREGSYRAALSLFQQSRQDPEILGRKQLSLLCGLSGPECLDGKTLEESLAWLDKALDTAERNAADPGWPTLLRLYRALAYDMLGRREQASEEYRKVLQEPDVARAHERAQFCLEKTCDRETVIRMLKGMSLKGDIPTLPAATSGQLESADHDPE